jgi:hypothetical protein
MMPDILESRRIEARKRMLRNQRIAALTTGVYLTRAMNGYVLTIEGDRFMPTQRDPAPHVISLPRWKRLQCLLPWPGKEKWEEEIVARAALLGGIPEFIPVADWSYDKGWAIRIEEHNMLIASGSRSACALAFTQYKIWEQKNDEAQRSA